MFRLQAPPAIKVSGIRALLPRADGAQLAAARKQLGMHLDGLAAGELAGDAMLFTLADEARAWLGSNLARLRAGQGTFRLNFHRFDRFELDLRGRTQP